MANAATFFRNLFNNKDLRKLQYRRHSGVIHPVDIRESIIDTGSGVIKSSVNNENPKSHERKGHDRLYFGFRIVLITEGMGTCESYAR
jgi:hypothetical protein